MPIHTDAPGRREHRRTWLLGLIALPCLFLLFLAGAVAWSWEHPIDVRVGNRWVLLQRVKPDPILPGILVVQMQSPFRTIPGYSGPRLVLSPDWLYTINIPAALGGGSYTVEIDRAVSPAIAIRRFQASLSLPGPTLHIPVPRGIVSVQ